MSEAQLQELLHDLAANVVAVQAQIETSTNPDRSWRDRATQAVGHMSQRKRLIKAELASRNQNAHGKNYETKKRLVAKARAALDAGDTAAALRTFIDWMDPDVPKGAL